MYLPVESRREPRSHDCDTVPRDLSYPMRRQKKRGDRRRKYSNLQHLFVRWAAPNNWHQFYGLVGPSYKHLFLGQIRKENLVGRHVGWWHQFQSENGLRDLLGRQVAVIAICVYLAYTALASEGRAYIYWIPPRIPEMHTILHVILVILPPDHRRLLVINVCDSVFG